jgi:hypothetical protein
MTTRSVRSLLILGLLLAAAGVGRGQEVEGQPSIAPSPAGTRQPARESRFAVGLSASISKGYAVGVQVGPCGQYWPTRWLGLQASASYLNDAYMYFSFYRVNGIQLSADVAFRFWRLTATLGPVMDHYFAPVVDKSIWGWHAGVQCDVVPWRRGRVSVELSYANHVDPFYYEAAREGLTLDAPLEVLLACFPSVQGAVKVTWPAGAR